MFEPNNERARAEKALKFHILYSLLPTVNLQQPKYTRSYFVRRSVSFLEIQTQFEF